MTTRIFIGGRQDSKRNCYPTGFEDREKGKWGKYIQEAPRGWKNKELDSSLEPPERHSPTSILILAFLASRTVREKKMCVVSVHNVQVVTAGIGNCYKHYF
jgi:hypothetical protein